MRQKCARCRVLAKWFSTPEREREREPGLSKLTVWVDELWVAIDGEAGVQSIQTLTTDRPTDRPTDGPTETPAAVRFPCVVLQLVGPVVAGAVKYSTLHKHRYAFKTEVPLLTASRRLRQQRQHLPLWEHPSTHTSCCLQFCIPAWPWSKCGVHYFSYEYISGDFGSKYSFRTVDMLSTWFSWMEHFAMSVDISIFQTFDWGLTSGC